MTALRTFLLCGLISLGSVSFAQRIALGGAEGPVLKTRLLSEGRGLASVQISMGLSHIDVDPGRDGFHQVRIPGVLNLEQAGSPNLPTTGTLIAVPTGYRAELEVISDDVQSIPGVVPMPAQKRLRCGTSEDGDFSYNRALYNANGIFPAKDISLETVGNLHGLTLVRVALNPARWSAQAQSLIVTRSLEARVHLVKTEQRAERTVLPRSIFEAVKSSTVNGLALGRTIRVPSTDRLLIVSADELVSAVQPYVDWKRSKGVTVDLVKASEISATITKEAVKAYVKTAYANTSNELGSLLFVGNKTSMPAYKESTASGAAATDYTYALLAGDDEIPDVTYGRVIADSLAEAETQINRWINYERNPEAGANWFNKGMGIASSEGSNPSDREYAEQIRQIMLTKGFTSVDEFYEGEDTATTANITNALSEGRSWISYFGHGTGTSWASTNDMFNNAAVAKLTNSDRLPVIIDVACQNASWINLSKCFGKAWVTQESEGKAAGAAGFYGGSVNISWHPPAIMSVGVAKAHFENGVNRLGSATLAGQLYLLEQKGKNEDTLDNLKWYNLFGDPLMDIRTSSPLL